MPNWCSNQLVVTGPEEALGRFHDAHTRSGDDGLEFTFEGSVPVPKVLRKVHSGGRTIDGERVRVWWERDGEAVRIDDRTIQFLIDRYGATNWYDWSVKNWSTKWDAGVVGHDASPGRRYYSFETAWSPPVEWAKRASALYPELEFAVEYEEPGMCFAGRFVAVGGAVVAGESWEYEPEYDEEDEA